MYQQGKTKKIIIIAIIVAAIIIGISLYFIIKNMQETATLKILVAPSSSNITIDGKKYKNGTYKIKPGNYQVTVFKEGFESQNIEIEAIENSESYLYTYLTQINGDDWYQNNEGDSMIVGSIVSHFSNQKIQNLYNSTPIISILPIKVDYYTNNYSTHVKYTISYQTAEDISKITLLITDYTGGNYNRAITNIIDHGYDIKNYEVNYIDKSSENTPGGHAF